MNKWLNGWRHEGINHACGGSGGGGCASGSHGMNLLGGNMTSGMLVCNSDSDGP